MQNFLYEMDINYHRVEILRVCMNATLLHYILYLFRAKNILIQMFLKSYHSCLALILVSTRNLTGHIESQVKTGSVADYLESCKIVKQIPQNLFCFVLTISM